MGGKPGFFLGCDDGDDEEMRARGNVNDAANSRAVSSERSGLERTLWFLLGRRWIGVDRQVRFFDWGIGAHLIIPSSSSFHLSFLRRVISTLGEFLKLFHQGRPR